MAGDHPPHPRMFDAVFVPGTLQTVCMSYILYPTLVDIRVNIHGMLLQLLWTRYFMYHTIVDSHVQNINAPLV